MSHHQQSLSERWIRRYATFASRRPFVVLAVLLSIVALSGWYGSGIAIRSNLADLFPDSTPAVQVAKQAQDTLKSSAQLTVMFGSPDRAKNRALAQKVCDAVEKWPDVAAVDCRRDIEFFRKNAALFLSVAELEDIDVKVQKAVTKATEKQLVDDALTEGLDEPAAATPAAEASPTAVAQGASPAVVDTADAASPSDRFSLPTDEDLKKRFAADDIREWDENADGSVLGIRIFPTIPPGQMDRSAEFVAKLRKTIDELHPQQYHPDMLFAFSGDYAEMTEEVDSIRSGLLITSGIALAVIALIQVAYFRRFRALLLMSIPLVAGSAVTLAFARFSLGYLNVITAFIFSMLFGMGNDFNVYTLSRYLEERSLGKTPEEAVVETTSTLIRALHQAALTTSVAFFALIVLDFRGFSQFGLIAGVGVEIALFATLLLFPPLTMAINRFWPDRAVSQDQAAGAKWMGWFTQPRIAKVFLVGMAVVTVASFISARQYDFETDFRKLRTEPKAAKQEGDKSAPSAKTREVEIKYRSVASGRSGSPIVIVADNLQDAGVIHRYLEDNRKQLTRLRYFVSIHSFVPADQDKKAPIIARIRDRLSAKLDAMEGKDKDDAKRALDLLQAKPYTAQELPDFVRKRFLDKDDQLGRYLLLYANGNLAEAKSIREVTSQVGTFHVGNKTYRSTASYFILAEADDIVRKEGPIAVILAAIAVLLVIVWHFKNITLCLYSFVPLTVSFIVFLALARSLDLSLNLFSVTTLPGILGIGIDGTTHILHRWYEEGEKANVRMIVQQVGGAAWIALVTTTVGFTALLFQDNRGMQSIGWMATLGLFSVCLLANILAGAMLAVIPPRRKAAKAPPEPA